MEKSFLTERSFKWLSSMVFAEYLIFILTPITLTPVIIMVGVWSIVTTIFQFAFHGNFIDELEGGQRYIVIITSFFSFLLSSIMILIFANQEWKDFLILCIVVAIVITIIFCFPILQKEGNH